MATFVNDLFSRMMPRPTYVGRVAAERSERQQEPGTLRAMPNEDIHLFIKRIDNNHVIRTEDKAATATCWKTIATACLAAVAAVGMIVPTAYGKLAGYQIERSRDEQSRLVKELSQLEAVEAQLLSPGVLAREAESRNFAEPAPEALVVLNVDRSTALAMNKTPNSLKK